MRYLIAIYAFIVIPFAAQAGDSDNSRAQFEIVSKMIYDGMDVAPVWSKGVGDSQYSRISYVKKKSGIVCIASIKNNGASEGHICKLPSMSLGNGNIQFEGKAAEIVYKKLRQIYNAPDANPNENYVPVELGTLGNGRVEPGASSLVLSTQGKDSTKLLECVNPTGHLTLESGYEFEDAYKTGVLPGPTGSYRCAIHLRSF